MVEVDQADVAGKLVESGEADSIELITETQLNEQVKAVRKLPLR